MRHLIRLTFALLLLSIAPANLAAQESDDTCPAIVDSAMEALDTFCTDVGRNQVCYGNVNVEAQPRDGVSNFQFEQVGDIEDVADLESLRLRPMDSESGDWGVAVMKLQANLPDTSPGQNVTFLLFGDVEMVSAVEDGSDYTPMQAFYLSTGLGDSQCAEAPESGLLVQTPEGATEVTFNINGVDVAMGSTVLFQAVPDGEMIVSTVEGSAVMNVGDQLHAAVAGTRVRWGLDERMAPRGLPSLPEAYDAERLAPLPMRGMERRIDLAPPLEDAQIDALHSRLARGELPCGEPGLPDCDRLPRALGVDGFRPVCVPDALAEGTEMPGMPPLCSSLPEGERPAGINDMGERVRDGLIDQLPLPIPLDREGVGLGGTAGERLHEVQDILESLREGTLAVPATPIPLPPPPVNLLPPATPIPLPPPPVNPLPPPPGP